MVARRIGWWRVLWNDSAASLFFFKFTAVALILAIVVLTDGAKGKRTTPLPFEKRQTQAIRIVGIVVSPCVLVGFLRAAWIKGKLERAVELQGVVREVTRVRSGERRVDYTYSYGGQEYRGVRYLAGGRRWIADRAWGCWWTRSVRRAPTSRRATGCRTMAFRQDATSKGLGHLS